MDITEIIKKFIMEKIITDREKINLSYDDSLIDAGIIDSLGIMKVLAFLDEEFSITIEDQDVIPENFETINAISLFIKRKKSILLNKH